MIVRFVYGIFPAVIFFTDKLVRSGFKGTTRGAVIGIAPDKRSDQGLIEHELTHVRQWYRTLGLHSFLYLFFGDYRLEAEVEAYRKQLKYNPDDAWTFAGFIATRYDLLITQEDAYKLLTT